MTALSRATEKGSGGEERARRITAISRDLRDRIVRGEFRLPQLPRLAAKLLALAVRPQASLHEVESAIVCNSGLESRILAVAKGPWFGAAGGAMSLHETAERLGAQTLREVLLQVLVDDIVFTRVSAEIMARERHHAALVACLSRRGAKLAHVDPGMAFACGLLHDCGRPFAWRLLDRAFASGLAAHERHMIVDLLHPVLGEQIVTAWELPETIGEVARLHHCHRGEGNLRGPRTQTPHDRMIVLVAAADRIAKHVATQARDWRPQAENDEYWREVCLDGKVVRGMLDLAGEI